MWSAEDWQDSITNDGHGNMMNMDPLHVETIYNFIDQNCFDTVLEIGSWDGFSTSAIVENQLEGKDITLICIDTEIRPQLLRVLLPGSVLLCGKSVDCLPLIRSSIDLAIVDGDHEVVTCVSELALLLHMGVKTFIFHDCGPRSQPGPVAVRKRLEADPRFTIWIDEQKREGMATDRGLMVASMDPNIEIPLILLE